MHKQMVIHPCVLLFLVSLPSYNWAEARLKIARMTLTIKRDGNWSSFQLANSALPLSVTSSAIAPSARIVRRDLAQQLPFHVDVSVVLHLALLKKRRKTIHWQLHERRLPQEKLCCGRLHRSLLRLYRPQSAVSCSTL